MARRTRRTSFIGDHLIIVVFLVLFVGAIIFAIVNATHVETHTGCVVDEKDRTKNRDGQSDARVYTDNCGVFQVQDSLLSWTWSSSDTYGSIDEGKTYDFKTRGFRVPFFSKFPNIVEATEVDN